MAFQTIQFSEKKSDKKTSKFYAKVAVPGQVSQHFRQKLLMI